MMSTGTGTRVFGVFSLHLFETITWFILKGSNMLINTANS